MFVFHLVRFPLSRCDFGGVQTTRTSDHQVSEKKAQLAKAFAFAPMLKVQRPRCANSFLAEGLTARRALSVPTPT